MKKKYDEGGVLLLLLLSGIILNSVITGALTISQGFANGFLIGVLFCVGLVYWRKQIKWKK